MRFQRNSESSRGLLAGWLLAIAALAPSLSRAEPGSAITWQQIQVSGTRQLTTLYREAITFHRYLAGHAIYRDAPARAQLAGDLRSLARYASADNP